MRYGVLVLLVILIVAVSAPADLLYNVVVAVDADDDLDLERAIYNAITYELALQPSVGGIRTEGGSEAGVWVFGRDVISLEVLVLDLGDTLVLVGNAAMIIGYLSDETPVFTLTVPWAGNAGIDELDTTLARDLVWATMTASVPTLHSWYGDHVYRELPN
ncbi:MAG: hypothetical protein E4H09_03870 [Spirochaetales bacterium]|nr:MAG: hypothetical protein E4H09_03870 [Spirochaetales bacterium]